MKTNKPSDTYHSQAFKDACGRLDAAIEQMKKDGESKRGYYNQYIFAPGTTPSQRKRLLAKLRATHRVIAIIRRYSRANWSPNNTGLAKPSYWATLRKSSIYNSKTLRDDMYNSPDYTWCMDTENAPSITAAKNLARAYAKKLGVRIIRFDERL